METVAMAKMLLTLRVIECGLTGTYAMQQLSANTPKEKGASGRAWGTCVIALQKEGASESKLRNS